MATIRISIVCLKVTIEMASTEVLSSQICIKGINVIIYCFPFSRKELEKYSPTEAALRSQIKAISTVIH